MILRWDSFAGLVPKLAPHLLPDIAAQTANNCRLVKGCVTPWKIPLFVATPYKTGTKQTIYLYEKTYWFHWLDDDVNVCRAPVSADAYGRVYWTGDGAPKMSVFDIVVDGPDYPTASYALGIPAPETPPTVTVSGSPPEDPDPLDMETRVYVYTYVSAYGEEGPPCLPSLSIDLYPETQHVDLSAMDAAPAGSYNITQKRIYRVNMGSEGSDYQLVATIAVATETYSDEIASSSLGVVMPSAEWDAPHADMMGLISLPNGSLAGFFDKDVCFSEPYYPHAWPLSYRIPVDSPIVGMGAYGMTILVATEGLPYIITGESPASMTKERLEIGQACVSRRGVVDMGYAVIYPAPDGLVYAGPGRLELITEKLMTRDEWQTYKPESIHAYLYDGHYIGFYNTGSATGGFTFDPKTMTFTTFSTTYYATAGYSDLATGKLYLQVGNDIVLWDGGATNMSVTWKSKPHHTYPCNFGFAKVFSRTYPITLNVYADGVLKSTKTVSSYAPVPLTAGFRAERWEVEVTGTNGVDRIFLANSLEELQQVQ